MALVTKGFPNADKTKTQVFSDESDPNTELTVTTTSLDGRPFKLEAIHVRYNASTTQTITVTKDSGKGAAFDEDLGDISISGAVEGSARFGVGNIFAGNDQIVVVAPALAAQTSTIEVVQTAL